MVLEILKVLNLKGIFKMILQYMLDRAERKYTVKQHDQYYISQDIKKGFSDTLLTAIEAMLSILRKYLQMVVMMLPYVYEVP